MSRNLQTTDNRLLYRERTVPRVRDGQIADMDTRTAGRFGRADSLEAGLCLRLNGVCRYGWLRHYFRAVSRLGNGVLWYTLLALIPVVGGLGELPVALHIGVTALAGVAVYKGCKAVLVRERPFVTHNQIACIGTPLDRGSFPSGHTIHAASFTLMLFAYYPLAAWLLLPVAVSIALSRVVLGQHYPSDVLAGALIGIFLALVSLSFFPPVL